MPSNNPPADLTEEGQNSLTGFVESYVQSGLADLNYAVTDLPGFLADPEPVTTAALFPRTVLRGACRSYARGGGPQNLPGFDAVWGGICEPYLDSLGETPTDGSLSRPFAGGQCEGVRYRVTVSANSISTAGDTIEPPTITTHGGGIGYPGPIRGVEGVGAPAFQAIRLFYGAGQFEDVRSGSCQQGCFRNIKIVSVQRVDGQPDDCGSVPPVYDPPNPKPGLPSVPSEPVRIPGIGPVNIDVGFDPSGNIVVNLPDLGIEVPVEVPIDIGLGGGDEPGGGAGPPPGDVGSPGSPAITDPGGAAEGVAPEGSVLTGLRCQILAFPDSRNKYTDEVYRGAYYAYMGVPGLLDLDFGGAMVREDQFLLAEKENLTAWRVRANTNYVIRTTPYYRSVE